MNTRLNPGRSRSGRRWTRTVGIVAVSLAFFASQAIGQSSEAQPSSKSTAQPNKAQPQPSKAQPSKAKGDPAPTAAPKHKHKKGSSCAAGSGKNAPLDVQPAAPGTKPKYVCSNPVVTLDSVWRGKAMIFNFTIGNSGDADLSIKVKKG